MRRARIKKGVWRHPEHLAERTGLEPATPGVTGRYSNQLNYRSGIQRNIDKARLCTV
ncbi:hypothetical protein BN874_1620045 [Candidatus Contendobacter odensis Run_B_J11]|uniref:Uncharacterized protein n=1 Tax=Candidatus Contendobacter odensis Run_B_J11 TaxID=1400861 RepID=A0A7U7GAA0_9GAMM|nr:hypothetical protein BN874_1620045 [Candidatus Contendobacter odensis Run_B_J11]